MAEVPPFLWSDAGTFTAPKRYTVPGSGEVQPYTATATYVNASGQAILPALRIKSDSGNLLALTFPVGQTIADGDSQEVTFVPPFGSASGSAGSGVPSLSIATLTSVTGATPRSFDTIATNDTSLYSIDGGDSTKFRIADAGTYLMLLFRAGPQVGIAASFLFAVNLHDNSGGTLQALTLIDAEKPAATAVQINNLNGSAVFHTQGSADAPFYVQVTTSPALAGGNLILSAIRQSPSVLV